MKLHKKLTKKVAKKESAVLIHNHVVRGEEAISYAQQKRAEMQQDGQHLKRRTEARTLDGSTLPDGQGWVKDKPTEDPELYCASIRVIPMSDGTTRKLYKMMVKPEVVKAMRKALKRKMRKFERQEREMTKRDIRALLRTLGKS